MGLVSVFRITASPYHVPPPFPLPYVPTPLHAANCPLLNQAGAIAMTKPS